MNKLFLWFFKQILQTQKILEITWTLFETEESCLTAASALDHNNPKNSLNEKPYFNWYISAAATINFLCRLSTDTTL